MHSLRARILALLTLAAVALPVGAFARATYFCRMMGRTVTTCCCGNADRGSKPSDRAELRAQDCCARLAPSHREAMPSTLESAPPVPPATLAAVLPVVLVEPLRVTRVEVPALRARAPPPLGPPLYIANCSLLS